MHGLQLQPSARSPSPVRAGTSSRISIRLASIKVFRSPGLTGDSFVRPALISRSAHRRRIAVSKSNPVSADSGCSAIVVALAPSPAVSIKPASNTGSSLLVRSTELSSTGSTWVEIGEPSRNSSATISSSLWNLSALISSPSAPALRAGGWLLDETDRLLSACFPLGNPGVRRCQQPDAHQGALADGHWSAAPLFCDN